MQGELLGRQGRGLSNTWTPKVCKIMAFWAIFGGFGLVFYILWGSRYGRNYEVQQPVLVIRELRLLWEANCGSIGAALAEALFYFSSDLKDLPRRLWCSI